MVFELELPPLRERRGDLDVLLSHFLLQYPGEGEEPIVVSPEARAVLEAYSWPGNVRELENVVQRAVVATDSRVIEPWHLPPRLRGESALLNRPASPEETTSGVVWNRLEAPGPFDDATLNLQRLEELALQKALQKTRGNLVESGRLLGISRATLYRKLKKYRAR